MVRTSIDITRKAISMDNLEDKVELISRATGIEFRFIPGTAQKRSLGYKLVPKDPSQDLPFLRDHVIGLSRSEANKTLNAILTGISFVTALPGPEKRDLSKIII